MTARVAIALNLVLVDSAEHGPDAAVRETLRGQFVVAVLKNRSGPFPKKVTLQFDSTSLRISAAEVATPSVPTWVQEPA